MIHEHKATIVEQAYEKAMSIIADENYDIVSEGGFLDSDFATGLTNIIRAGLVPNGHDGWMFKESGDLSVYTMGLNWKVNFQRHGFVSCSNDDSTGVSRTEGFVIGSLSDDDIKNLLDMMNEAWYLMTSNQ